MDTRTHTYTHTSGRQVKITFLDALDYSEYSETNISKKFFLQNSFLSEEAKWTSQVIESFYITIYWTLLLLLTINIIKSTAKKETD